MLCQKIPIVIVELVVCFYFLVILVFGDKLSSFFECTTSSAFKVSDCVLTDAVCESFLPNLNKCSGFFNYSNSDSLNFTLNSELSPVMTSDNQSLRTINVNTQKQVPHLSDKVRICFRNYYFQCQLNNVSASVSLLSSAICSNGSIRILYQTSKHLGNSVKLVTSNEILQQDYNKGTTVGNKGQFLFMLNVFCIQMNLILFYFTKFIYFNTLTLYD